MAQHEPRRRPKPAEVPQQPRDRRAEIRAEIRDVQQQIEARRCDAPVIRTPEDLTTWERTIAESTDRRAALLLAEVMQAALGAPENRLQARSLAQGAGHTLKDQGPRDVTPRTACGPVTIRATYFSRNCPRDKPGKGMYPMPLLRGVHDRCTAAVASETSKLVAMPSSFEEVEQVLRDRGRPLDLKAIRAIADRFATRARAAPRLGGRDGGEAVAGRRVILSTDGGRMRIRTTQRGPKTAQGRHRSRTDGRAPKLRIISVVEETGPMDRDFPSVLDGTRGGPDAVFKLREFS